MKDCDHISHFNSELATPLVCVSLENTSVVVMTAVGRSM